MTSARQGFILPLVIVLIALVAIIAAVTFWQLKPKLQTQSQQTQNQQALQSSKSTSDFQVIGIRFSYNSQWKVIGSKALFSGNLQSPFEQDAQEIQYFFFDSANWQAVQQEINKQRTSSNSKGVFIATLELAAKINSLANFSLTCEWKATAQSAALQGTQTVCNGQSINFSTSNPVNPSRVQTVTLGQYKAYLLPAQKGCNYQTTQIYLDANRSAMSSTVLELPPLESSPNDSFIFSFNNTSDLEHLSQSQKIVLNSIQLP